MPQIIKIVVMGAADSGKTQLAKGLTRQGFEDTYIATIGVDFYSKPIDNNKTLRIWDTAGQDRFKSISHSYYRGADLFIYCIDSSQPVNQKQIEKDLGKAKEYSPNARVVIVATKSNEPDKIINTVTSDTINVDNQKLTVIKTSAKNNELERLNQFLIHFANGVELKLPSKYLIARKELVSTFEVLHKSVKADLLNKLSSLDSNLADDYVPLDDKIRLLKEFSTQCEVAFKDRPSTLTRVLEIIAIIALPILVGVIGFGVGFALGLWTGPGAFLSGLAAGHAAAVTVTAVTGASTLVSGGLAYGLFRPVTAPTEIKKFDEVARAEFYLPAA